MTVTDRPRKKFTFTESGLPTLAEKWQYTIPPLAEYPATPSGSRARGQVENMLDHLCKKWIVEGSEAACTAELLARQVEQLDGKPCSQGAVHSVFEKWRKINYAMIEDKPLRFIGLTVNGMSLGLDEIYRRERRKRKGTTHYAWPDTPR